MPIRRIDYSPIPYVSRSSLGDLLRLQGAHQADAELRRGQMAQQTWGGIGQLLGGALQDYATARQQAPIRAQQEQARQLKLADDAAERQSKQEQTVRAKALEQYFTTTPDPTLQDVVRIAGPMEGPKVFQAWYAANRQPQLDAEKADREGADRRQTENQLGVRRMVGEALVQGAGQPMDDTRRQTLQGMALQEGVNLPSDVLPKPATPPAVGSFEDYVKQTYGVRPTSVQMLQARKDYQQADDRPRITVNTGGANIPGNFDLTGAAFLESIPKPWRKTVEKIAGYDEDPTKVASMRGGMRETLMQWVNQVNPGYDASQFSNRAPTRKAYTTGTQGKQINNINTAIGHIDQLTTVADQLQNGGFVPGNRAWNSLRTMFGADQVTNFDTLKDALAGEVAGALSQSGATVSGIADAQAKIHASSSPTQLAGYVKTLIPVMGSKLASLDYQYHQAMGEGDTFSALSPDSKRILTKHGFDPAHPTIGGPPKKIGRFEVEVQP